MGKLKPCSCGTVVEVKYICGFGGGLDNFVKNKHAGNYPAYYIDCPNCGESLEIRVKKQTVSYRDKCKKELIEAWNKRVNK